MLIHFLMWKYRKVCEDLLHNTPITELTVGHWAGAGVVGQNGVAFHSTGLHGTPNWFLYVGAYAANKRGWLCAIQ